MINGVGVDGVGGIFPFLFVLFRSSSRFRFSSVFFVFLCFFFLFSFAFLFRFSFSFFFAFRSSRGIKSQNASCQMGGREVTR